MSDRTTEHTEESEVASSGDQCETTRAAGRDGLQLVFTPPMSIRRYNFVSETIAARPHIHSVVDFGCAGGHLVTRLSGCLEQLEWVVGVDIDKSTLSANASRIQPATMLYSVAGGRSRPLYVALFQGSLTDYDQRMACASAVTLVEVIEHLENDVLEGAVVNVFGRLAPELVIVTTPNAEFNVLIPGLRGMRHYDHKFEWTRFEFQKWCRGICEKYSYDMSTHEIGEDPLERDVSVGCCTQAAIFTRREALPSVGLISLEVEQCTRETTSKISAEDGRGGHPPGSTDVFSAFGARGESTCTPDVLQYPTQTCAVCSRLESGTCDRSSERVTSAGIAGWHPGDPASADVSCDGCLRKADGYSEEAALEREHQKHDCVGQMRDCGEGCFAYRKPYSLIAEYFVPARQQPSPTSELANELLYQLLRIRRSREEEQCFTYDDQILPPCYFCANSSSPPESLTSDDDGDDEDFVEYNRWPALEESEPKLPSTDEVKEWWDCAVNALSTTCPSSDRASAPIIEEHHGHIETTAGIDEAASTLSERIRIHPTASPSCLQQELAWGDDRLHTARIVTDSEHSTADVSEDGDLAVESVVGGLLLGSMAGSGDAVANVTVDGVADPVSHMSIPSALSIPGQGDDGRPCLRWPLLSEATDASSKDPVLTDDLEECSRCPIHIAVHCLLKYHRIHELCDGQPSRVAEAVRRLGYDLVSRQRVVVYRRRSSRRGC